MQCRGPLADLICPPQKLIHGTFCEDEATLQIV